MTIVGNCTTMRVSLPRCGSTVGIVTASVLSGLNSSTTSESS
jgi:hypothetical protein